MTDQEIHKLIMKFAHYFIKNYPCREEWQDIVNESYLIIDKLKKTFDPEKGKLSYYLWLNLKRHFGNKSLREKKIIFIDFTDEIQEYLLVDSFPSMERFAFLNDLSNNSKLFVETVLDSSDKLEAFIKSISIKSPLTFSLKVGKYLGFSKKEVFRIRKELLTKLIY